MSTSSYWKLGICPAELFRDNTERDRESDRLKRIRKSGTKKRRAKEKEELKRIINDSEGIK